MSIQLLQNYGINSSQSSVFTPPSITGNTLWLDPSDSSSITLNGSNISQINDKSGNANHFSQGTASLQPLYDTSTESLNTIKGDGVDDQLTGSAQGGTECTIFAVVNEVSPNNQYWFSSDAAGPPHGPDFINGYGSSVYGLFRSTPGPGATPFSTTATTLSTLIVDVNGGTENMYLDSHDTTVSNLTSITWSWNVNWTSICRYAISNIPSPKNIGEIIVYDNSLSAGDRQTVFEYLEAKWGTPI